MKRILLIPLIALFLLGCAYASRVSRTGPKTFVFVEAGYTKEQARKHLAFDADHLCCKQYKIKSEDFAWVDGLYKNDRKFWRYTVEIECLNKVDERFLDNWDTSTIIFLF